VEIGAYESCASLTRIEDEVYESDGYWFHGRHLTEPGYYTTALAGPDCDSVIGLTLYVLLGNEEHNNAVLAPWPNPTTGILHLEADDVQTIEVYNLMGQSMLQCGASDELDLSQFKNGVYFIRIIDVLGKSTVHKVLKE
jgi:hypothetical protein